MFEKRLELNAQLDEKIQRLGAVDVGVFTKKQAEGTVFVVTTGTVLTTVADILDDALHVLPTSPGVVLKCNFIAKSAGFIVDLQATLKALSVLIVDPPLDRQTQIAVQRRDAQCRMARIQPPENRADLAQQSMAFRDH
ncbi:hypothetical protein D3M70_26400 [Pseudomonas sp. LS-2]|nr:hypothetical protein D3M70_26400 [Pseudomonas sp. LS-2]